MNKVRAGVERFRDASLATKVMVAGVVATLVGVIPGLAGATTPPTSVTTGFGTLQTKLVGYLGLAVTLVLALVGLAIGIRMLVKWGKRAGGT